jgi:hypothetical protein
VIRKNSSAKNHAIGANKTVSSNGDRFTVLAVALVINAVTQELGVIASNGGEGADAHLVGAINVVMFGNSSVVA